MVHNSISERIKHIGNYSQWLSYAMKSYSNPHLSTLDDFEVDVKRFSYVQSLLFRYINKNELCDRLILNHIIVLVNMFGPKATVDLFYAKADKKYWPALTSFFLFLNLLETPYQSDTYIDSILERI